MPEERAIRYTAAEAARILRLSSQRVRQLLSSGELRGERDEAGHWAIDPRSVSELLEERREILRGALEDPQRLSELEAEVRELRYLLGRAEASLEFAKGAENALRAERHGLLEELERERERAASSEGIREEARRLREELEAERSKGFWRRLFGG